MIKNGKKNFPGMAIIPPLMIPKEGWKKVEAIMGAALYPGEVLELPSKKTIHAPKKIIPTPKGVEYSELDLLRLEEERLPTRRALVWELRKIFQKIPKGSQTLCLTSGYSPELWGATREQKRNTFCIDLRTKTLQVARIFHPQAYFACGPRTSLPFKDGSFNYVLALNTFGPLLKEIFKPVIEEIHRVLKPRGVVLELNDFPPSSKWYGKGYKSIKRALEEGRVPPAAYERLFNNYYDRLTREFKDVGFSIRERKRYETKKLFPLTSFHRKHPPDNVFVRELHYQRSWEDEPLKDKVLEWIVLRGFRAVKRRL